MGLNLKETDLPMLDSQAREMLRDYVIHAAQVRVTADDVASLTDHQLVEFFSEFSKVTAVYEESILLLVDQMRRVLDEPGY